MAIDSSRFLKTLTDEISRHNTPENQSNYQQFFKEKLKDPIGLKTPVLRKISKKVFKGLKGESTAEILKLGNDLLLSGKRYMRFFAIDWAINVRKGYRPDDFALFESWLKRYVDGWGNCDHLCCGPLGNIILTFPNLVTKTKPWRRSKGEKNRWLRRASAVSLIVPVKGQILLDEVFEAADTLLTDTDDMVQKGYGWMLKEASNQYPEEVFDYVIQNKAKMPRTALRYSIEKLSKERRTEAMKKDG